MFGGPDGVTAAVHPTNYNAAEGRFNEVSSNNWIPFDFGSPANFAAKVDNSVVGQMHDCGECHVGGGAMEYVPYSDIDARVSYRDIAAVTVNGDAPITASDYTAFNYFIDAYDVDGDGNKNEVVYNDYTKTGVMEMDCLICHLEGYQYQERVDLLRISKFDASRAVGAGIASDAGLAFNPTTNVAPVGYGTSVVYDLAQLGTTVAAGPKNVAVDDALILPAAFVAKLKAVPPSDNCASCHMNKPQVDWKKRGYNWKADTTLEVHYYLDCMGCHERKDGLTGVSGVAKGAPDSGWLGLCDPAKGNGPYGKLWNAKDDTVKTCADCHLGEDGAQGTYSTFGAPNPRPAHEAAGLTAEIVQKGGYTGSANASHLDLIDCSGCHVRMVGDDNTGNALIDGTGADEAGRLADHEGQHGTSFLDRDLWVDGLGDTLSLQWKGGRLLRANPSITLFWRDKNDVSYDVNSDGRGGGMDALLATQVNGSNVANGRHPLTFDGTVDTAEIALQRSELAAYLDPDGLKDKKLKLSFFGVPFKITHNVSPSAYAFGAGGCADCHAPGAGFYNGAIDLLRGTGLDLTFNAQNSADVVPFTKVNGLADATNFHPTLFDKSGKRSIPLIIHNGGISPANILRLFDRSEMIYETTFMARNTAWQSAISGSAITFPTAAAAKSNTKGWLLKVEVTADGGATTVARTFFNFKAAADFDAAADKLQYLLDQMAAVNFGTYAGNTEFSVAKNATEDGLLITAGSGYAVRLHPQTTAGPLGLYSGLWQNQAQTGVDGNSYSTRNAWVAYLNAVDTNTALHGVGVPPAASASLEGETADRQFLTYDEYDITQGDTLNLLADTSGNTSGTFSYVWSCNDAQDLDGDGNVDHPELTGASASKAFNRAGVFMVTLNVYDEEGKKATDMFRVRVLPADPVTAITLTATDLTADLDLDFTGLENAGESFKTAYVVWGDGAKDSIDVSAASGLTDVGSHSYDVAGDYEVTVFIFDAAGDLVEAVQADVTML